MIKIFGTLSLLLAGSFLFSTGTVKDGVWADGVEIGGMSYAQAEEVLLEKFPAVCPFTLRSPAGDLETRLTVNTDIARLVRRAKKGERLQISARREWATAEEDILTLCKRNARDAVNAEVSFGKQGFTYTPEQNGIYCDYNLSLKNALAAAEAGDAESEIVCREYTPEVTLAALKERTQRLGSFTTYFDGENLPRVHNIALAADRIAGTVLQPHQTFSFNETVGQRTEENGFEIANVIFGGEFVPGVGGGVCQASTTLMNAALHAGLTITESRPHSLSVSYVPPSLDAMVSEYSDLKFENPYGFPVYLSAATGKNFVRFTFYGKPDGNRYETQSSIRYRISPPPAKQVEGDEEAVIRSEKEGIASESYLLVYDAHGSLVSRTLIRRDTYAALQGIYQTARSTDEEVPPAENGESEGGEAEQRP